ncbi:MAG: GDP-L-fucose synthase [Desulfofustis sp.]|nr:GDP-L-fucose synthase [Desulfofustis sp.]
MTDGERLQSLTDNLSKSPASCRIFIAGHRGMVGSAILRLLQRKGYRQLVTRRSAELDLTDQQAVRRFFAGEPIDQVYLAAARVGGIYANNTYPAEFIQQNLMIQANVIHESWRAGVKRLLFLGSSCIYPRDCRQPMSEDALLTGPLEATNEPYAVAKIAGIKMCEAYNRQYDTDYRAVMPTNLYGPGDTYHLQNSHVIPAIIRKYHLAVLAEQERWSEIEADERVFGPIPDEIRKSLGLAGVPGNRPAGGGRVQVTLWGSGQARREFLHVDDMASACHHLMEIDRSTWRQALAADDPLKPVPSFVNIGVGKDCTIRQVAELIREMVGFHGETRYDTSQPDGTPQKLLDTRRLTALGWRPSFSLADGLRDAYAWYRSQAGAGRLTPAGCGCRQRMIVPTGHRDER